MRALILVDLQNDFLPGGALAVARGDETIAIANLVAPSYELVVATQDFHPPGHQSFASQHPGRSPGDVIDLFGLKQVLWPDHCVQGTHGAELAKELERHRIERIFPKGTDPTIDSYSGFYDNGRRRSTGLGEWLSQKAVTSVDVLGLATDYCVRATALDAIRLGFRTTLLEDGCRAVDLRPGDGARAIEELRAAGAAISRSSER
ncbi:MAG: bifunctional nicotinamidase/pyrazinamidase [Deltaproteobacteria bacterium]|nr:bifunctional nicotinamidase/pyrazinamidase [Deltaproteobacteria bacterium]